MLPRARASVRRHVTAPPGVGLFNLYRASTVGILVLALVAVPLRLVRPDIDEAAELQPPEASAELDAWTVDVHLGGEPLALGAIPRPVKGQKRAPCIAGLEVDLGGYCWLPIQARPPNCPKQTLAYGESCLLPMAPQQGPPVSIDAGVP